MLINLDCATPNGCCGDSCCMHAEMATERTLPSGVDEDRRATFNHCYSLTPTASFSSRITSWAYGALLRSCSISVVRTDRDSFASYIAIHHTSYVHELSYAKLHIELLLLLFWSHSLSFGLCGTFSNTRSSGSCGLLTVMVFRFFPSTPYAFRLRGDYTGKNVADIRLSRPPFSRST